MKLYKFYWDCSRMGCVEGIFATEKDVSSYFGKSVYFGEILGKHSDISGTLEECDFTLISEDSEKINWLVELCGNTISGYNPLEYLEIED